MSDKTSADSYREKTSPDVRLMAQIAMCQASQRAADPSIFEGDVIMLHAMCPQAVKEAINGREEEHFTSGEVIVYMKNCGHEITADMWDNDPNDWRNIYDPTKPITQTNPKIEPWERTDFHIYFGIIIEELGNAGMWFTQTDRFQQRGEVPVNVEPTPVFMEVEEVE